MLVAKRINLTYCLKRDRPLAIEILYLTKFNIEIKSIKPIFVYLKIIFQRRLNCHQFFNMNTTFTKHSLKALYLLFAIAAVTLISACGKSDTEVINYGSLSIYNTSPTSATYDAYINSTKANSVALPYAGGIKYAQLNTGTYDIKFTTAGETASIYTKNVSVATSVFSSLYLVGTSGNFDGLFLTDDFSNTSTEKAYVRFINLSPDAAALDLGIKDATTNLATNKAYKAYSGFVAIDPGAKVLEIKGASTTTVKATVDRTFVKGTFYTVIAGGKVTPGTNERAFNGQIIVHQ